ncbi:MAG: RNA polymerase factor sigma-54 [Oxalobacter formigenes]|nr:RNA polymerase factor sigma-54 [Oxalobacter formigenes]
MELKQTPRLVQRLALTPALKQSIRFLQLSAADLNAEIDRIVQNNPLLEKIDSPLEKAACLMGNGAIFPVLHETAASAPQGFPHTARHETGLQEHLTTAPHDLAFPFSPADEEDSFSPLQAETPPLSLKEYLAAQIRPAALSQRQLALAGLIIDAIDDNGYLIETPEQMLAWLPEELHIRLDELEDALRQVQALEPAGIAARDSAESLALQLKRLPGLPYVTRKRALAIVENHLNLLARHDFARLRKQLDCDEEDLKDACQAIQACQPHPGAAFSAEKPRTIVPELLAFCQDGQWQVALNPEAIPAIRLNHLYAGIARSKTHVMAQETQEAGWLVQNIRRRFETILKTGKAIVQKQQAFFSGGPLAMNPLVLREIADTLELHESTVSRVTNGKYMRTPHGVVELKYFFGSGLSTLSGQTLSSTAIREKIRQLIGEENRKKPLSDNKIAQILLKEGLVIARRTIAKYREALKIPPACLRKSL